MRKLNNIHCRSVLFAIVLSWFFCFFNLLSIPAYAQQAEKTVGTNSTLEEVLELVLEHSPRLKAARLKTRSREQKVRAAQFRRLPDLEFNGSAFYSPLQEKKLIPRAQLGAGQQDGVSTDERFNDQIIALEAGLKLPLYTGGEINSQVEASEARSGMAGSHSVLTRDQLMVAVTDRYFKLLKIDESIRATKASIRALSKTAEFIKKKVQYGKALPVDLLRINTRLSALRVQLQEEESAYKKQLYDLSALTGISFPKNWQPDDSLAYHSIPLEQQIQPGTIKNNPEVQLSRFGLQLSRARKQFSQSQLIPDVNFKLKYGFFWGNDAVNSPVYGSNHQDLVPMISLSFPIVDFSQYNKIKAASFAVRSRHEAVEQTRLNIQSELQSALLDVKTSKSNIQVAKEAIQTSREAFRVQQSRFESGKATVDDLLNAEAARLRARLNYLRVLTDYYLAVASVYRIKGNISIKQLSAFSN